MTHHIHHLVDQLLLEQGEYRPLEFLLQEGRLSYADYEAWRNGELDFLDEALFGDPDHIQQDLLQAEEYLQRRGWQAETLGYEAWRRHAQAGSRPLRFSANTNLMPASTGVIASPRTSHNWTCSAMPRPPPCSTASPGR